MAGRFLPGRLGYRQGAPIGDHGARTRGLFGPVNESPGLFSSRRITSSIMSYRSIKRVLGETSLERKCRLLFGACLLLLIGGAFWGIDRITSQLVITTARNHCRDLADIVMIKVHALKFETRPMGIFETRPKDRDNPELAREWLQEIMNDFEETQNYGYEIVSLETEKQLLFLSPVGPKDEEEAGLLAELEKKQKRQRAEEVKKEQPSLGEMTPEQILDDTSARRPEPVYVERHPESGSGYYHYFEAVKFQKTCLHCHTSVDVGSVSATDISPDEPPMVAIKVILPYEGTATTIRNSRAILIAVAILTVFLAVIALYLIVRYVIVKPLQHLRDVSDEVSRGKQDVRADIHTNDEFEDLAHSFNRMLRHLTDAQRELRRVNTDLDGKVDELAQLNMRLYEMNRLKDDFLANMSHELRTPLNSIIGFSEVLQGINALNDKQKRYASNIQNSGRVLLEMINDILDLAKMEAGKMEIRPSEFHIDKLIQTQCDMVRSLAEDKNIDLIVDVNGSLPKVYQDQAKVQQILTNLLSNAIKFTPEGGRIVVTADHDREGRLVLTVADTGVGIAEEDKDIIFEKFRQSSSILSGNGLTREYSGTGLGLSILRELCKLMHGEISFESELGQGSTFTVVLPWVSADRSTHESSLGIQLHDLTSAAPDQFLDRSAATAEPDQP